MTDPSEKRVTVFSLRGWTFRLIVDPHQADESVLEQFVGRDALGGERWVDADLEDVHRSIVGVYGDDMSGGTHQLVREVAEAVAIELLPPHKLSVDARTLLARALDECVNGAGMRGLIQANPFEVFELLRLTEISDIERLVGDRDELRS